MNGNFDFDTHLVFVIHKLLLKTICLCCVKRLRPIAKMVQITFMRTVYEFKWILSQIISHHILQSFPITRTVRSSLFYTFTHPYFTYIFYPHKSCCSSLLKLNFFACHSVLAVHTGFLFTLCVLHFFLHFSPYRCFCVTFAPYWISLIASLLSLVSLFLLFFQRIYSYF